MKGARPSQTEWVERVLRVLDDDVYVNLGIGWPTKVLDHVGSASRYFFHCENGLIGTGEQTKDGPREIIDAASRQVRLRAGAAVVDLETSFGLIRGGHLDATVLGAHQVSRQGDLANWMRPGDAVPGVGGAMDLAAGARKVCVMMPHRARDGRSRIVDELTFPVTARRCVDAVVTELATLRVTAEGLVVEELAPGIGRAELEEATDTSLIWTGAVTRAVAVH